VIRPPVIVMRIARSSFPAGGRDDAERTALALTECVTRLADKPDAVPDDVWNEAARRYDEQALAALLVQIAQIDAFNRPDAAVLRQLEMRRNAIPAPSRGRCRIP
jgi:alkylhydroperoxidase family enzyme